MKEAVNTRLVVYEAILSNANNVSRVSDARHIIEQAGGKLHIAPLRTGGMTLVTLTLPAIYTPDRFVSGLPFFPSSQR